MINFINKIVIILINFKHAPLNTVFSMFKYNLLIILFKIPTFFQNNVSCLISYNVENFASN